MDVVEDQSDDSVVEVDENEEDPLAALRGKLQRLSFSEPGQETSGTVDLSQCNTVPYYPASSEALPPPLRPKVVTEYVRRGTRVTAEECEVTDLDDLPWDVAKNSTPVQLRSIQDRLNIFLKTLGSDTPSIRAIAAEKWVNHDKLSGGKLLLVVTLRWVLQILHARAEGSTNGNQKREREMEKWTRSEAEAFLLSLSDGDDEAELPCVEDRPVQLTAQILSAFEAIEWLAEALLLVDPPRSQRCDDNLPGVLGVAQQGFSGKKFHAALMQRKKGSSKLFQQLWEASTEGLLYMFGNEKGRRKHGARQHEEIQTIGKVTKVSGSRFGTLTELHV